MKHDAFFRRHPVFRGKELADHLTADGRVGKRRQESLLAYHIRTGRLVRIRRGLFAAIPPEADSDTYPFDPYLVTSRLTADSVLSHHTALEFHGRAYSLWHRFTYLAARPLDTFTFRSQVFRETKFPETLVRSGGESFGVSTAECAGMSLKVTSLERTFVDVLDRPLFSGGWEEVWRSLESVEFLDLDRTLEYVLLLANATTAAKVAFYLEKHREALMAEERHLTELREKCPRQPHYVDRKGGGSETFVAAWNLVVPTEVVERSWEEIR